MSSAKNKMVDIYIRIQFKFKACHYFYFFPFFTTNVIMYLILNKMSFITIFQYYAAILTHWNLTSKKPTRNTISLITLLLKIYLQNNVAFNIKSIRSEEGKLQRTKKKKKREKSLFVRPKLEERFKPDLERM